MIIRKACSRELTDLGLIFNSLNIKVVQSEVAEARRRQSAAEAQANADIVAANQSRRAKEAQLEAERAISDKQRELEQTQGVERRADRAGRSEAAGSAGAACASPSSTRRRSRRRAPTRRKVRLAAEASADAEAIRIRRIADATAESIQKVNQAIQAGGESYFRYRQIEMLPQIAPAIADALAAGEDGHDLERRRAGAPETTTNNITSVIQTVLAAQLVSRGLLDNNQVAAAVAQAIPATGAEQGPAIAANRIRRLAPPTARVVMGPAQCRCLDRRTRSNSGHRGAQRRRPALVSRR